MSSPTSISLSPHTRAQVASGGKLGTKLLSQRRGLFAAVLAAGFLRTDRFAAEAAAATTKLKATR